MAFASQTNQSIHYQAIQAEDDEFSTALTLFRDRGGKGMNVTVPFKLDAYRACTRLSGRARMAEAVNTISIDDTGFMGDNTDGTGLVRDLENNHDVTLAGASILILGAGGAVRGILGPLLEQHPARITIANRTPSRAEELVSLFPQREILETRSYEKLENGTFDIIINGTSASLSNTLPPLPDSLLATGTICYDLMYADKDTVFVHWGRQKGARIAVDGLGMLVEQAAESFYIWRGIRPDTSPVIRQLRGS